MTEFNLTFDGMGYKGSVISVESDWIGYRFLFGQEASDFAVNAGFKSYREMIDHYEDEMPLTGKVDDEGKIIELRTRL